MTPQAGHSVASQAVCAVKPQARSAKTQTGCSVTMLPEAVTSIIISVWHAATIRPTPGYCSRSRTRKAPTCLAYLGPACRFSNWLGSKYTCRLGIGPTDCFGAFTGSERDATSGASCTRSKPITQQGFLTDSKCFIQIPDPSWSDPSMSKESGHLHETLFRRKVD